MLGYSCGKLTFLTPYDIIAYCCFGHENITKTKSLFISMAIFFVLCWEFEHTDLMLRQVKNKTGHNDLP